MRTGDQRFAGAKAGADDAPDAALLPLPCQGAALLGDEQAGAWSLVQSLGVRNVSLRVPKHHLLLHLMKAVLLGLKTCSQCGDVVRRSTSYYCDHCDLIYGGVVYEFDDYDEGNIPQSGERRTL
jgi:hypothetical protein